MMVAALLYGILLNFIAGLFAGSDGTDKLIMRMGGGGNACTVKMAIYT